MDFVIPNHIYNDFKWGTPRPIIIKHKEFGLIEFSGYGYYSFSISNLTTFVSKFGQGEIRVDNLDEQIRMFILTSISEAISDINSEQSHGLEIWNNIQKIQEKTWNKLQEQCTPLGITIKIFTIGDIRLSKKTKEKLKNHF